MLDTRRHGVAVSMINTNKENIMNDSPIKEIRFGPGNDYIKAAVWENQTQKGQTYHSVKLSRHYRDDKGWNETQTLYAHHLPLAQLASGKAFEFIHERAAELREQEQGKEPEAEKSAPATKRGRRKTHTEKLDEERGSAKSSAKGK